jgi:hypothetical protein
MALSDRDRAVLDFERSWWIMSGIGRFPTKEACIRERLDLSPARYYQLLNRLVERPDAADYDPLVVHRVRRRRSRRRRERYEGRSAGDRRMR